MKDIQKGFVRISEELIIFPGYLFEQFKSTKFYNAQDGVKIIYLDEKQIIDDKKYIVSLFFRDDKIYMLSLICCEKNFTDKEEVKRKILHDEILKELGIQEQKEYIWGKVSSDYDIRSNIIRKIIDYYCV